MTDSEKLLAHMPGVILENPELRRDLLRFGTCCARFSTDEHGSVMIERVDPLELTPEPREPDPAVAYLGRKEA